MTAGRVLVVAGSDSGGGAGIQADIKTITVLGGYAATAITAVTAQNTLGVHGVETLSPRFVAQQMHVVLEDIGADCIKTGMLANAAIIDAVTATLATHAADVPLVLDPVMVATSGDPLLETDAIDKLGALIRRATVLTPNLPEAELLLGGTIDHTPKAMGEAARALCAAGPDYVLLKGGHLDPDLELVNVLATATSTEIFTSDRVLSSSTHGTGCTLASAIATGIARGVTVKDAVGNAIDFVREAIRSAPAIGSGHGPLNHGCELGSK